MQQHNAYNRVDATASAYTSFRGELFKLPSPLCSLLAQGRFLVLRLRRVVNFQLVPPTKINLQQQEEQQ